MLLRASSTREVVVSPGRCLFAFFLACLALSSTRMAVAASAVAAAPDHTVGYAFNHPSEASAQRAALQSCKRRTDKQCQILVSCSGEGYGAIAYRRYPAGHIEALGASCGASTPEGAYKTAIDACNSKTKTGRCGQPRTAWRDTKGAPTEPEPE